MKQREYKSSEIEQQYDNNSEQSQQTFDFLIHVGYLFKKIFFIIKSILPECKWLCWSRIRKTVYETFMTRP